MILVIGYGNPLRGDDGIGQVLVKQLAARFVPGTLQTLPCFQLTPELAEPISRASGVLFIDAHASQSPGTVCYQVVQPESRGAFVHHVTPGSLLATATQLYGRAPAARLISIGVASLDYATELSPAMQAFLPFIINYVENRIRQFGDATS